MSFTTSPAGGECAWFKTRGDGQVVFFGGQKNDVHLKVGTENSV